MKKFYLIAIIFAILLGYGIARAEEKKIVDTNFVLVSTYLVATTIFDIETTFSAIRNGVHEANPIMRPFIKRGRGATYGMQMGINAIVIGTSYLMKKSDNPAWNKKWWIIPSVWATGHGIAGGLNLKYVW